MKDIHSQLLQELSVRVGCRGSVYPFFTFLVFPLLMIGSAQASPALDECLDSAGLVRVARVQGPDGSSTYVKVLAHADGQPTAVVPIADGRLELAEVFERAIDVSSTAPRWTLDAPEHSRRICTPIALSQEAIDSESQVVVAAGLNYAAHAEEAGGGDVFLFPKPVAPSGPYGEVTAPEGVRLLDYEVELGFVLLAEIDLNALPSRADFLAQSAFFVANEITDRGPIIRYKALSGPGTGFVEGKGQPGFLPAGPWLVRGSDLFSALATCGEEGLGLRLEVDEGDGFRVRQEATTAAMIVDPYSLLSLIAKQVLEDGMRTSMPVERADGIRYYPFAAEDANGAMMLPAGSVMLTGTPEGVALGTPDALGLVARGLLHLRSPFAQFHEEEIERAENGAPGGYLAPGHRVRAQIDGLGTQSIRIGEPGTLSTLDSCDVPATTSPLRALRSNDRP